jgi:hypothetical protein
LKLLPLPQTLEAKVPDRQHGDLRRKLQAGWKLMAQHKKWATHHALQLSTAAAFEGAGNHLRA